MDLFTRWQHICKEAFTNLYTAPFTNLYSAPFTNLYTALFTNIYAAPFTNLYTAPFTNQYTAPFTNLYTAPFTNLYTAPFTNLYTAPLLTTIMPPKVFAKCSPRAAKHTCKQLTKTYRSKRPAIEYLSPVVFRLLKNSRSVSRICTQIPSAAHFLDSYTDAH